MTDARRRALRRANDQLRQLAWPRCAHCGAPITDDIYLSVWSPDGTTYQHIAGACRLVPLAHPFGGPL